MQSPIYYKVTYKNMRVDTAWIMLWIMKMDLCTYRDSLLCMLTWSCNIPRTKICLLIYYQKTYQRSPCYPWWELHQQLKVVFLGQLNLCLSWDQYTSHQTLSLQVSIFLIRECFIAYHHITSTKSLLSETA